MRINLTTVALKQFPFVEKGQRKIRDAQLPGFGVIIGKRSKTFFVMSGTERKTQTKISTKSNGDFAMRARLERTSRSAFRKFRKTKGKFVTP